MNPWASSQLQRTSTIIRFVLWAGGCIIGAMAVIFAIAFSYHFLTHVWDLLMRTIFSGDW